MIINVLIGQQLNSSGLNDDIRTNLALKITSCQGNANLSVDEQSILPKLFTVIYSCIYKTKFSPLYCKTVLPVDLVGLLKQTC